MIPLHRRLLRRSGLLLLALLMLTASAMLFSNWQVNRAAEGRLYTAVADIPEREVGLVLGTSDRLKNGRRNLYFDHRITAAAELYKAGKVRRLLLSGDNRRAHYDEPAKMRAALLAAGVPESAMTLDYAGFRTLDSVVRARKVFGLTSVTIISQRFHNQRAIFLAQHGLPSEATEPQSEAASQSGAATQSGTAGQSGPVKTAEPAEGESGLDAIAFCADDPPLKNHAKILLREAFARVKAVLDVELLHTQPKHLGSPEQK